MGEPDIVPLEFLECPIADRHRGDRRVPGRETLGHGHQIGHHPEMLRGEHPARPAEPGDHLVHDQQDPMLLPDLAEPLPVLRGRHVITVGHRDRLADHRRDVLRPLRDNLLFDGVRAPQVFRFPLQSEVRPIAIRGRHKADPRHERSEVGLVP